MAWGELECIKREEEGRVLLSILGKTQEGRRRDTYTCPGKAFEARQMRTTESLVPRMRQKILEV